MRISSALIAMAMTLFTAVAVGAAPPLVDVPWVQEHCQEGNVGILDIRNKIDGGSKKAFRAGHIPGAVYSNYLTGGWRATVDGVIGQLPPAGDLERLIGGLGIGNGSHVVIVAGGVSALDMGSATRVYFTFKVLGHDEVSILDGGYKAYAAEPSALVETGPSVPQPAVFAARFRPELLASREDVIAVVQSGVGQGGDPDGTALLDHRPPDQYAGKKRHPKAKRAGTIPGARSVPEGRLTEGGRFVSAGRVAELLRMAGLEADGPQISFCNTGHWASLGWFASSEILGNKKARLYDGSMVDWSARDELPVELGAGGS